MIVGKGRVCPALVMCSGRQACVARDDAARTSGTCRKSFGSVVAADQVDLTVSAGEALGIIGPNGAGKTTLFNLIAGGLSPDAGSIRLDGTDITRRAAASALHRGHRPLVPDPAAIRESHRVRESCWSARSMAAASSERDVDRYLRRHPRSDASAAARQCAGGLADAARAQAPGNGARARDRSAAPAARRNRRRADRRRMPGTGRDHPPHPCRAAPPSSGSSMSCMRLLAVVGRLVVLNFGTQDRRRPSAHGDEFTGGAADLYGHRRRR